MKNLILFLAFTFIGLNASAQKFAYIDTEYILLHMQEYADAQAELNAFSAQWQEEIEQKYASITLLTESYQAEKALLTADMQQRREQELKNTSKEARDLQKRRFGVDGDLFQKREELMKPVQESINDAMLEVCSQNGYMVIFDISDSSNILYANPKYNVSDKVLKKMGKTPGETIEMPSGEDKGGTKNDNGSSGGQKPQSKGTKSEGGNRSTSPREKK